MRRGEIRLVDFEPSSGQEANKRRPAILVSNDAANSMAQTLGRGVVTVIPLTSKADRVMPFQVLLPASQTGLPKDSKAQAEQIRSVSITQVGKLMGTVTPVQMNAVDATLLMHLGL